MNLLLHYLFFGLLLPTRSLSFQAISSSSSQQLLKHGQSHCQDSSESFFLQQGRKDKRTSLKSSSAWDNENIHIPSNEDDDYNGIPSSCVQLIDPATGCEVILIGCFHGSMSSAKDVKQILANDNHNKNNRLVLELCPGRYQDVLRRAKKEETKESLQKNDGGNPLEVFVHNIQQIVKKRGWSIGLVSSVLMSVNLVQTTLSGGVLVPGLEFITALQCFPVTKDNVVLADQLVDETLSNLSKLPQTSWNMNVMDRQKLQKASNALQTAIWGNKQQSPQQQQQQLQLLQVLTRNPQIIYELLRTMIPPLLLAQCAAALLNQALFYGSSATTTTTTESLVTTTSTTAGNFFLSSSMTDFVSAFLITHHIPTIIGMFAFLYYVIAVPIAQILLVERDDTLTEGIRNACNQIIVSESSNNTNNDPSSQQTSQPGRVIAVLGMLHVNGIANRLLSSSSSPSSSSESES